MVHLSFIVLLRKLGNAWKWSSLVRATSRLIALKPVEISNKTVMTSDGIWGLTAIMVSETHPSWPQTHPSMPHCTRNGLTVPVMASMYP